MAPLKVVLSLLIAVLHLDAVCGECEEFVAEGNCDFYSQCLESRIPCGRDGYALGYGDHYCRRFGELRSDFNEVVSIHTPSQASTHMAHAGGTAPHTHIYTW